MALRGAFAFWKKKIPRRILFFGKNACIFAPLLKTGLVP
jgi:hypothetical protein